MQDGSVTVERRKRGPDIWCFRWREGGPDGRRLHRRIVLGTADDLKGIASSRKAVVGQKGIDHVGRFIETFSATRPLCAMAGTTRLELTTSAVTGADRTSGATRNPREFLLHPN